MVRKKIIKKLEKIYPTIEDRKAHLKKQETWCSKEEKYIYNPTLKKHCPFCGHKFDTKIERGSLIFI